MALVSTVVAVTGDGITVSAVYNDASADGEIHSVTCANNSQHDTIVWAIYKGAFQSLSAPAGQTTTQNLPGNVRAGDVTAIGFGL